MGLLKGEGVQSIPLELMAQFMDGNPEVLVGAVLL